MLKEKRGLSTIVITLILILLSIVAVGLVWFVVNNIIKGQTKGIDIGTKCINVNIEPTAINCDDADPKVCDITFERSGTESGEIGGVKIVFRDTVAIKSSELIDESGNIQVLVGKTINDVNTGLTAPDRVEVTTYFKDASGKEQLCSQTNSLEF